MKQKKYPPDEDEAKQSIHQMSWFIFAPVNSNRVRSYRVVLVASNIVTKKTNKSQSVVMY